MTFKELSENYIARIELKLPPQEWTIFCLLMSRGIVSTEAICIALWGDDEPETIKNIIGVKLAHIRKTLRNLGVEINSHWGRGHSLSPEAKTKLLKYFLRSFLPHMTNCKNHL